MKTQIIKSFEFGPYKLRTVNKIIEGDIKADIRPLVHASTNKEFVHTTITSMVFPSQD